MPDLEDNLAPYAMPSAASRRRRYPEPTHPFRTMFQRDRERIVHSSAFRRMTGKTQVLVASVNDHHRTRLTHTLEVTQIARTVARRLRLNEDLVEAIALAHDIGHPPYGHAGEQALHECLLDHGGFNHNIHGLRRVDLLEDRYPEFPGLNLTYEVREAFVRHAGYRTQQNWPEAAEFGDAGSPRLEADIVDDVDSIAYDTHDLDDALSLGLISFDDLAGIDLVQDSLRSVRSQYVDMPVEALRKAVVRDVLAVLVNALLDETSRRIENFGIRSLDDVRACSGALVGYAEPVADAKRQLERFLREHVYLHPRVLAMTTEGKRILKALFEAFVQSPELLPMSQLRRWAGAEPLAGPLPKLLPNRRREGSLHRVVGDYLAGMTDRFAQQEHLRLFSSTTSL